MEERQLATEMKARGVTCLQIAKELGKSPQWVSKWTPRARIERNWDESEVRRLARWRSKHLPFAQIAKRLGRTPTSCRVKWCRLLKSSNTPLVRLTFGCAKIIHDKCGITEPGRMLRAIRKSDVIGRAREAGII